MKYEFISRS